METISWLLPEMSRTGWMIHGLILSVNLALLFLARPIINFVDGGTNNESKIRLTQFLNALVLVSQMIDIFLLRMNADYEHYFINVGLSVLTVYTAMFIYTWGGSLSKKRFGNTRVIDDKTIYLDTYSTRLVNLILLFLIIITTVYVLIKTWGADSMLEATGIFGILAALLAFSSSIWAPDIVSGLIILNTQMLEDGDVVIIDGFPDEYIISKVTLFYVVLYDIRNNHRTLLRNSHFMAKKIDNLSKVASTDGIRQSVKYNIGYPEIRRSNNAGGENETTEAFSARIGKMFDRAFQECIAQENTKINENRAFEWALTDTGDDALEYSLWVYLQRIPNTKVTSTIRKHLMGTMHSVNEAVYRASVAEGVDLSTPKLTAVTITNSSQAVKPLPAPAAKEQATSTNTGSV